MAKRQPTTKGQLANISGVGPVKLERYGDDIIKMVKESQN
jgi:superfamily II DNA helicase RecQ